MDEFDLYLRGFAAGSGEPSELGLSRLFGLELVRARELVRSLPRVVKRRIPFEQLERYEQALQMLGADYELQRSAIRPARTIRIEGTHDEEFDEAHGESMTLPPPMLVPRPASRAAPAARVVPAASAAWGDALDIIAPARPAPRPTVREPAAGSGFDFEPDSVELPAVELPELPASAVPAEPRAPFSPSKSGELPPASQVPGLGLDGRPDWLVSGPRGYDGDVLASEPPPIDEPSVRPPSSRKHPEVSPETRRGRSPERPTAVGTIAGRELAIEPSRLLRWALRTGIGVSLFVLVTIARINGLFDRSFEQALASFEAAPEAGSATPQSLEHPDDDGPEAETWLESDRHQVVSGDKDRVQALVARFRKAGALGVRIGQIQRSGVAQVAGELRVVLPSDLDARRTVLAEYRRVMEATFGGFVGELQDPPDNLLHLAL